VASFGIWLPCPIRSICRGPCSFTKHSYVRILHKLAAPFRRITNHCCCQLHTTVEGVCLSLADTVVDMPAEQEVAVHEDGTTHTVVLYNGRLDVKALDRKFG